MEELFDVGLGRGKRFWPFGSFLVETSGQPCEAAVLKDFPYPSCAQAMTLILEDPMDIVNGIVFLA